MLKTLNKRTLCFSSQKFASWHINNNRWHHWYLCYDNNKYFTINNGSYENLRVAVETLVYGSSLPHSLCLDLYVAQSLQIFFGLKYSFFYLPKVSESNYYIWNLILGVSMWKWVLASELEGNTDNTLYNWGWHNKSSFKGIFWNNKAPNCSHSRTARKHIQITPSSRDLPKPFMTLMNPSTSNQRHPYFTSFIMSLISCWTGLLLESDRYFHVHSQAPRNARI